MDDNTLLTVSIIAILGLGAVIYFYFTYRYFVNWRSKQIERTGKNPPIHFILVFVVLLTIPPIYTFYLMTIYGPIW